MSQTDYLRECMSDPALVQGPVPMDEFNKAYCVRCVRKECSRAGLNSSLFARRTASWKADLFEKPPRAAEQDPRYDNIRAKKFLQIVKDVTEIRQGGVNYEVQTREMPDLPPALRRPEPAPQPEPVQDQTVLEPPPLPVTRPASSPAPAPPPAPAQTAASPQNTPFEQGTVLPGGQAAEQVTEVGGSYVFGSDE